MTAAGFTGRILDGIFQPRARRRVAAAREEFFAALEERMRALSDEHVFESAAYLVDSEAMPSHTACLYGVGLAVLAECVPKDGVFVEESFTGKKIRFSMSPEKDGSKIRMRKLEKLNERDSLLGASLKTKFLGVVRRMLEAYGPGLKFSNSAANRDTMFCATLACSLMMYPQLSNSVPTRPLEFSWTSGSARESGGASAAWRVVVEYAF